MRVRACHCAEGRSVGGVVKSGSAKKMVRAKTRRGMTAKLQKAKKAMSSVGSSAKKWNKRGLTRGVLGSLDNVDAVKRETPSKQKRRRGRPKKSKVAQSANAPMPTLSQSTSSCTPAVDTSGGIVGVLGSLSGCVKTTAEEDQVFYTTKKDNECVMEIAKRLRVDAHELVTLNADEWPTLRKRSKLHPGTRLRLPAQYLQREKERERQDDDASPTFTEVSDFCPLSLFISHSFRQERLQRRGSVRARLVF